MWSVEETRIPASDQLRTSALDSDGISSSNLRADSLMDGRSFLLPKKKRKGAIVFVISRLTDDSPMLFTLQGETLSKVK